jgi:hypothetical protein
VARKLDKEMKRTIGVMTKIDLYEGSNNNLNKILSNQIIKLKMGFVCTSTFEFESDTKKVQELQEKLSCLNLTNFGRKALIQKLEKVISHKMKSCLFETKSKLEHKLNELKNANEQSDLFLKTLSMSKETKLMYLLNLINSYTQKVKQFLEGNLFGMNPSLKGAALINEILDKELKEKVMAIKVQDKISLEFIYITILNTNGFKSSLFVSQKAFEILIVHMIKSLIPITLNCLKKVIQELLNVFETVWIGDDSFFPNFRVQIIAVIENLISQNGDPTKNMIEQFFEVETGFINTKHPDFLMLAKESFSTTHSSQDEQSDEGTFDLKKLSKRERNEVKLIMDMLINYFDVVKKNVCDYVSKIIITLLVKKSMDSCERELISKLYKEERVDDLFKFSDERTQHFEHIKAQMNEIQEMLLLITKI